MKKILFILILSLSAIFAFAQNTETKPAKAIGDFQIVMKKFYLNISIENKSIVKDLTLKPNEGYENMYLSGNWGTIEKKISFNNDITTQTVQFIFVVRVVKIDDAYKIYKENEISDNFENLLTGKLFSDVKTKKILCQAEFQNSSGETIKQDLEINFDKENSADGDEIFAKAKITDENLGLNIIKMKVNTEKLLFKFSLRNDEFGINMVIDPAKPVPDKEIKVLAGKAMPDGIYPFICRMGLPNGITKEEKIEAFVSNGVISLDNSSFNPLVFANGDYGKAIFAGKTTLVKMVNSRSTAVTIFIPNEYAANVTNRTNNEIKTDAFTKKGAGWNSYVIPAGGSIKIKMKVSLFPIVIYDVNRQTSEIVQIGLVSKNFQILTLGWGSYFSLK